MQIQLDHIAGSEPLWWQVREEQFVDHPCACHPNRTLLFPGRMGGHDYAAPHSLGSHWHVWAIIETADHLAFWALLELIWWEVQACLNERMIEQAVFFPTGHKREPSHIGKHGSRAILPIEPEQDTSLGDLVRGEVPLDRGTPLA